MPKAKPKESEHICEEKCCCDWSPHRRDGLWALVMLMMLIFAFTAGLFLLKESNELESEITGGQIQDQSRFMHRFFRTGSVFKPQVQTLVDLAGTFTPYSIKYPYAWHVEVMHEDDAKTQTTTIYTSVSKRPIVSVDGADTRPVDIELTDMVVTDDKAQQLILADYSYTMKVEKTVMPAVESLKGYQRGYEIYKITPDTSFSFNPPSPKPPFPSQYTYLIFYSDVGPEAAAIPHVLIASVVTQEGSDGLVSPSDVQAVLDQMVASFVPPSL